MLRTENEQAGKPVKHLRTFGQNALAALLCLSLTVWSIAPNANHAPLVFEVVADHAEMIADHGHSHGLEEDLYWALHGHSHDVADHDHSQALLALGAGTHPSWGYRDNFRLRPSSSGPHRVYMIERPPRA
ncbi:MAG: hypothetical protein WEB56_13915 [Roseovarius sp.]